MRTVLWKFSCAKIDNNHRMISVGNNPVIHHPIILRRLMANVN